MGSEVCKIQRFGCWLFVRIDGLTRIDAVRPGDTLVPSLDGIDLSVFFPA